MGLYYLFHVRSCATATCGGGATASAGWSWGDSPSLSLDVLAAVHISVFIIIFVPMIAELALACGSTNLLAQEPVMSGMCILKSTGHCRRVMVLLCGLLLVSAGHSWRTPSSSCCVG